MAAYYNEIDPFAAQWLRNLIKAGHIADGTVDERSIEDVRPSDLKGFTQCHFFAGIGVWSYALRNAGWPDDRPVWTGSCPCQPFSAAGAGAGFADERHLWPAFFHLIEQCKPAVVFGEQVASKDANPWIDLVQTDLEAVGYGVGAIAFPSASVGAPHIRDRLYWVADTELQQRQGGKSSICTEHEARGREQSAAEASGFCGDRRMADAEQHGGRCEAATTDHLGAQADRPADQHSGHSGASVRMADTSGTRPSHRGAGVALAVAPQADGSDSASRPSPTNGFWRDADWLLCRDGKWRPVRPGTFPLAHGVAARVGRLRAYGNAINAQAAQAFIECVIETI